MRRINACTHPYQLGDTLAAKHIPEPLRRGILCTDCRGTGADIARTLRIPEWDSGYVRCWTCCGGGLDPAEYFRWAHTTYQRLERLPLPAPRRINAWHGRINAHGSAPRLVLICAQR